MRDTDVFLDEIQIT